MSTFIEIAKIETIKQKKEKLQVEQARPADLIQFIKWLHKELLLESSIIINEIKTNPNTTLPILLVYTKNILNNKNVFCCSNFLNICFNLHFINSDDGASIKNINKYCGTNISISIESGPLIGGYLNIIITNEKGLYIVIDSKVLEGDNFIIINNTSRKWWEKLMGKNKIHKKMEYK